MLHSHLPYECVCNRHALAHTPAQQSALQTGLCTKCIVNTKNLLHLFYFSLSLVLSLSLSHYPYSGMMIMGFECIEHSCTHKHTYTRTQRGILVEPFFLLFFLVCRQVNRGIRNQLEFIYSYSCGKKHGQPNKVHSFVRSNEYYYGKAERAPNAHCAHSVYQIHFRVYILRVNACPAE